MQVFLETERLALRRFTMADAGSLVSLDADPDVMRFVTGGIPTSREEIENEILPAFLGYHQRYEDFGFWAAIEKATGEFLGWFHFRPRQDAAPGEVELGYRLRKSAWGKGYATEGSRALIRKGFTEFGVQRVVAEAMAVNQASRRVMQKAGLKLVRTFHQPWPFPIDGDQFGVVEYALDKTVSVFAAWPVHPARMWLFSWRVLAGSTCVSPLDITSGRRLCGSFRLECVVKEPVCAAVCGPFSAQPRAPLGAPQRRQQAAVHIARVVAFHHAVYMQAVRGGSDLAIEELREQRTDGGQALRAHIAVEAEHDH